MARKIISDSIIDDVLIEADPSLDTLPDEYLVEQRQMLRPLLNQVVKACRTPAELPAVVARTRKQAVSIGTAVAFQLFVENIEQTGGLSIR
ncbi:hypothetical protein ACEU07_21030 [Chromobacterium violaceum]|uniref:hypothetical protein n=1 Tax=Chromobacterium violaceum TaxID=536 RepID=UPI0035A62150